MAKGPKGDAAARAAASRGAKASSGTPVPLSNERFAAHLHATLRDVPGSGRFGDKVFIDAAHEAFARTPEGRGITLAAFKSRLVELNRSRHLDLSRADLVEAMDPERVRRSETLHFGASYHFIRPRT